MAFTENLAMIQETVLAKASDAFDCLTQKFSPFSINEKEEASMNLAAHIKLDGFEFGRGGYGKVLRGVDTRTGGVVAVKHISGDVATAATVVKEVAIMKRLGAHPNIVRLIGYEQIGNTHCIAMEAILSGELFARVNKNGMLPEEECRFIFAQMLAGVQHMHRNGIAHRDLKLENALLDNGRVVWIDFGLAHMHRLRADGQGYQPESLEQWCGSPSYCAPELLARRAYNGYAVDVWSLGICLFAMASGFFPCEEASGRDWRFPKLCRAQLDGHSSTHAVFGFYSRQCPFSEGLVALLDNIIQIDPRKRLTPRGMASAPWLRPAIEKLQAASQLMQVSQHCQPSQAVAASDGTEPEHKTAGLVTTQEVDLASEHVFRSFTPNCEEMDVADDSIPAFLPTAADEEDLVWRHLPQTPPLCRQFALNSVGKVQSADLAKGP